MRAVLYHASLVVDLLSMKLFVWLLGTNGELLDSHLFFYDRYSLLADWHRANGRDARAARFDAIAETHFQAAPDDDGSDDAAAMAMPIPRAPIVTDAIAGKRGAFSALGDRRRRIRGSLGSTPPHPLQPTHAR
jgi:hypothetical protein